MATLTLYDYWRSSAAYRVRIVLGLKGLAYRRIPVDLLAGEQGAADHRGRHPQGFVPALDVDGTILTQSLAIADYLDTLVPDPPLLPAEPLARARVRARALVIAADIHPLDNLRVLRRLKAQFGADQSAIDDWYRHWIAEGFAALEAMSGEEAYLSGAGAGLADACLVPQMYNARRFDLPLDPYPRLVAIDAALQALPQVAAAHPDRVRPAG